MSRKTRRHYDKGMPSCPMCEDNPRYPLALCLEHSQGLQDRWHEEQARTREAARALELRPGPFEYTEHPRGSTQYGQPALPAKRPLGPAALRRAEKSKQRTQARLAAEVERARREREARVLALRPDLAALLAAEDEAA